MPTLPEVLEVAARNHAHVCPRIVLGGRVGLAGAAALGFRDPPSGKRLLAIVESDGCFVDGVSAATGCTVGHRTLRVEDYGKVAATFVDVRTGRAFRVAPALDAREKAAAWLPHEPRHYFAQLQAYQTMPDELLLTLTDVHLVTPVCELVSRPGLRVNCDACGEEIINERQVISAGHTLCRACAGIPYYQIAIDLPALALQQHVY